MPNIQSSINQAIGAVGLVKKVGGIEQGLTETQKSIAAIQEGVTNQTAQLHARNTLAQDELELLRQRLTPDEQEAINAGATPQEIQEGRLEDIAGARSQRVAAAERAQQELIGERDSLRTTNEQLRQHIQSIVDRKKGFVSKKDIRKKSTQLLGGNE